MKLCLIFPYGGKELWMKLSLREFSDINWLIILANKPTKPSLAKFEEVSKELEKKPKKEFYKEAKEILEKLKDEEKLIPTDKRRKFSLLEPISTENFYQLLHYFRALLSYVEKLGYQIMIHLNSGLMIWRMALYLAAAEFKSSIYLTYLFNKDTGDIQKIWIYRDLSEQEKIVLEILSNNKRLSISEIQKIYKSKTGTGTLSYVLKIVKSLVEEGILLESKEGRTKYVVLSELGKSLGNFEEYSKLIKEQLEANIEGK